MSHSPVAPGQAAEPAVTERGEISYETAARYRDAAVLMIYIEPAPYIVGFVEQVRACWRGPITVVYVELARSQPWGHLSRGDDEFHLAKGMLAAIRDLRRRLGARRYALLHLAGWGHPLLLAALFLARLHRTPVTIESDTPSPASSAGWKSAIKRLAYPRLFALPRIFLPGGTRQAAYLRDFGVEEARIRVAQMTVDVEHIRRRLGDRPSDVRDRFEARHGLRKGDIRILYLGRLEPHKGIEDLLQAYREVVARRPDVSLLIAGDGSLRDRVLAAQAECESIRYVGRLSGDDVWDAYCAADIFVLPSHAEPWGLVVNEAMAAGLPVIVTDRVGCVDDLVQDGVTGLVVPAEKPDRLAAAISRLIESSELRRVMGQRGGELISGWTLRNQAERTVAAWRDALARR